MQFSGAVKLHNLSDYIAPSQACVVNLKGGKLSADDDDPQARRRTHAQTLRASHAHTRTCCLHER
jgi:hypothetical protein